MAVPNSTAVKNDSNIQGKSASSWNQLLKDNEISIYVVFKCVFKPSSSSGNTCGGFWLIFEGEKGTILHHAFWVTDKRNIGANCSPREPWRKFKNSLKNLGSHESSLSEKLTTLLYTVFQDMDRVDIFEEAKEKDANNHNKLKNIELLIRRGFEKLLRCILDVDCAIEFISRKDLESEGILQPIVSEEPKNEQKSEDSSDDASNDSPDDGSASSEPAASEKTFVNCLPFVEPVSGIPASELKQGDCLEVEILGNTVTGDLVKKLFQASGQELVFPIESIEVANERTKIFLRINEDILGLVVLTKDLKLRTRKTERKTETSASGDFISIIVLCSLVVVIIILFIYIASLFIF